MYISFLTIIDNKVTSPPTIILFNIVNIFGTFCICISKCYHYDIIMTACTVPVLVNALLVHCSTSSMATTWSFDISRHKLLFRESKNPSPSKIDFNTFSHCLFLQSSKVSIIVSHGHATPTNTCCLLIQKLLKLINSLITKLERWLSLVCRW